MILRWARAFAVLPRTQLLLLRIGWFWYLVMMSLQPLSLLLFIRFLLGPSDEVGMRYLITGNVVLSLSLSSMLSLGQDLGWLKDDHAFDYYATLPVPRSALVLAIVSRSVLLALPSITVILLFSVLLLRVPLRPHPLTVLVLPLGGASLSGVGAVIGFYSPSGRVSNLVTQIIHPITVFLAPVYVPLSRLPKVLQLTSTVMPTTYVARALGDCLTGEVQPSTLASLAIVGAVTIVSLVFVERGLDWRGGEG